MKKLFSIFAALLFAGSMMAAVGNLYYTLQFVNTSGYSGYATYKDFVSNGMTWNIPGNMTQGDFDRIGGNTLSKQPRDVTAKSTMGDAIARIIVTHNGGNRKEVILDSITVTVASDANFTEDVIVEKYAQHLGNGSAKIAAGTITLDPTADYWAKDSYYKVTFFITNSSSSNGGLDVANIAFYSYQDPNAPAINAPKVDLGAVLTTTLPFQKETTLEVTGANLNDAITYSVLGSNVAASGTLTSTGGTLNLTLTASAEGAVSDTIVLVSGTAELKVAVEADVIQTEGAGTKASPLTCADVIKINNRTSVEDKYWVLGYIVGSAANNGVVAESDAATNLALGATVDQTANIIPVELPSGEIRTALNIVDNTENKGKLVKVHGVLQMYFNAKGVKAVDDYEFVTVVEPTYYLKNNWGGGEWTWQQTTKVSDNEYKLENVVFGGTGVNVNTAASDEGSSWIAHESFNGNPIKALDTVTLTYVVSSNSISAILLGSYVAPADPTWTVAGSSAAAFGTTWAADNADNDMVKQSDGTFLWERTGLVLAAGSVNFKVCRDHAWTVAYPSSDYSLAISADGIYTITITFDPSTNTVSATATKTGDAVVTPVIELKGSWNAAGAYDATWNGGAAYTFVESGAVATYTVNFTETGTYELGLQVNGAWTANGATITRTAPGTDLDNGGTGNMHLVVDVVGEYEFIWTYAVNNLTVMFPDEPVVGCDWDNIDFLGDGSPEQTFGSQFKVCKPDNVGVVNIQKPGFADETGIYMTFPSAAFGTFSLAANQYAIQGAGVVFYLSAFSLRETEVTVNCEGNDIVFTVYNAKGVATGIENNAVVEKAVKFIENGQLIIMKNGVKYDITGAIVK